MANETPYNKKDAAFSIEVFKQIWTTGVLQQWLGVSTYSDEENTYKDRHYGTDFILSPGNVWIGFRAQKGYSIRTHTLRAGRRKGSKYEGPTEWEKHLSHVKCGSPGPDLLLHAYLSERALEFALMKTKDFVDAVERGYSDKNWSNAEFKYVAWITPGIVMNQEPVLQHRLILA